MGLLDYNTEKPERTLSNVVSINPNQRFIDEGKLALEEQMSASENPYARMFEKTVPTSQEALIEMGKRRIKERGPGLLKSAGLAIARGVPALGQLTGHALKTLDPEGGIDVVDRFGQKIIDVSEKMAETDIMRPRMPVDEGFVGRGIRGGLESTIPSFAPMVAGAGAGAAIGSVVPGVGTVIGGIIGGAAATLGIHGLGVYGQEKERYLQQGIDEKTAHKAATQQGLVEGGIETVSNIIGMLTFGWGKLASQPLKQTAKELLKTPVKTFAKNLTKNALLNEVPTEMIQGALGAKIDERIGLLPEGAWQEAAVESIIPALTMSVIFGLGAQGATSLQRNNIKKQLNSEDPEKRVEAAQYIAKNIDDNELRQAWINTVTPLINEGSPININADFTQTTSNEIDQVKADIKSGLMAEGIKSGDLTSEMMAPVIEKVATQDPALARQITDMFAVKETDLTENERRFEEDPLDAKNNAEYLDKYIKRAALPEGVALTTEEKIAERAKILEEAPRRPAEVAAEVFEKELPAKERKPEMPTPTEPTAEVAREPVDVEKPFRKQAWEMTLEEYLAYDKEAHPLFAKGTLENRRKKTIQQAIKENKIVPEFVLAEYPDLKSMTEKVEKAKVGKEPFLELEAKKYKTAEEFVAGQGKSLFHGTSEKFTEFDIEKFETIKKGDWGKGIYLETTKTGAKYYRDQAVGKTDIEADKAYKKLEALKQSDPKWNEARQDWLKALEQARGDITKGDILEVYLSPKAKILKRNTQDGITDSTLSKEARDRGYDVIHIDKDKFTEEIVVVNPDVIKTKSQLTDIWNKAHAKPLPPKPPKAKPSEAVTKEIEGEVIPEVKAKVEKEKVEVTPEKKEPWKITRDEYVKQYIEEQRAADFPEHMITDKYKESIMRDHFAVVSKAFAEDKAIPPEVLKDYPDLKIEEKVEAGIIPEGKEISKLDLTKQYVKETGEKIEKGELGKVKEKYPEEWAVADKAEKDKKNLWDKLPEEFRYNRGINEYTTKELKDMVAWEKLALDEFEKIPLKERGKYTQLPKSVREERLETERWAEEQERKKKEAKAKKAEKKAKLKAPIEAETGIAWIKNVQKPILSARKITRGKNKDKYEIVLTKGRDAEGNVKPGLKRIVAEDAIIKMPDEKQFAIKAIKPQDTITRADLKSIFSKMKNISTGVDKDGNFFFRPLGKPVVTILEVNEVKGYIDTSKGQIPVGSFLGNTIELKTGGEGHTADIGTAWHEYEHWMEANGILSNNDIKALDTALEKQGITPNAETRAEYVGDRLSEWQGQKNLRIRRVLKKIADFVNSIWEFVTRTRTARGVLADIETGRLIGKEGVSERAGALIPAFQMAGEKAIGAPTGQLVKAQELLAEGKDKKEVWRETGWMKGVEGKWKFEIDDSGAKFNAQKLKERTKGIGSASTLSQILTHPELYKSYPQLRRMLTIVDVDFDRTKNAGSYTPAIDRSSEGLTNLEAEIKISANSIKEIKPMLLHEIAHAIQEIEGFARGGTPKTFEAIRQRDEGNLARTIGNYNKLLSKYAKEGNKEQYAAVLKVRDELTQKAIELQDYTGEKSFEDYKRLAGEIEARDTSARALLSSKHRKEIFPYEAQAIPEDQWIITKGKGTSFSIEETKQFATKPTKDYKAMLRRYQEAHTTPLVDELVKKTQADFDPVSATPEETKAFFKDIRLMPKRFRSEVLSIRDMKWYHKAFETPYVLAKKFASMKAAVKTEINRHESRTKKMFSYYHGDLADLQKHMQKNPEDLKAFESLVWEWEGHRFSEKEVPTDWYSVIEDVKDDDYGGIRINPEHYTEVRKYLKKQGVKDVVADGFVAVRKTLDNVLIEADATMRGNNIDPGDLKEFRSYIGKAHNYFSHIREGNSYIKITNLNTKKTVYREHFWALKERALPERKMAKTRTEKWLNDQLASGKLSGKRSDYLVSPAQKVTKLPDEIFFQIPVEALSQISIEAGKGLSASRVHYEALRLMKKEGLSEKEAHEKAGNILTADMGRILAKAMSDVLKTRGWGKHAIQRQNIPGFKKTDVFETLSGYLTGYAGFATKIQAAKEHSKTLRDIDARKTPAAYKYTSEYVRDMLANADKTDQMVDRLRGLFFVKYLGGVVKSGIVNLTQNAVMAGPVLSQYTKFSHTKLAKAMKDVRKGITGKNAWMGKETDYKTLPKNEQLALTEGVETGVAQDLYLRELKGDIPGKGWGKYVRKVIDKSGIFMMVAEKFNRASTLLAAYRVGFNEGVLFEDKQTKGNHDLALQFAKKVVYDSHFLYGKPNLPAGFRGGDFRKIARAAYTFRSFTHNYLDIMVDLMANQGTQGFKVAGRSLMNLMVVGGLTSIPFFKALSEVIKWASDDEDEDLLTEIRGTMSNKFMQDVLVYGLVGASGGFDLSGSLSIEVPRSFKDLIGVPYAVKEDYMNMVKSVKAGNLYRAVSETPFTPIVMRNAMRGIELYTKGQRTRGGKAINVPGKKEPRKITGAEAIKKGILGLQPTEVSSGYKAYRAATKMKRAIADRKRDWADRIANATIARDFKKVKEIKAEIREWNTLAKREGKRWRIVDITEMVKGRLTGKGLRGFPVKMRKEVQKRYSVWQ